MNGRSTMGISYGSPYASEEQYRRNREMLIDPYMARGGGMRQAFAERYDLPPEEVERIGLARVYADSVMPNAFGVNFVSRGIADALRRDALRRRMAGKRLYEMTREQLDVPQSDWTALMRYIP